MVHEYKLAIFETKAGDSFLSIRLCQRLVDIFPPTFSILRSTVFLIFFILKESKKLITIIIKRKLMR